MADPRGFLKSGRELPRRRPVDIRLKDWHEVYEELAPETLKRQAGRCMDCGIPFCHQGCPLGNMIPEWNDLVWRDDWSEAIERLHATNNFPEFTGTLCPAPCESACVLGINSDPVTIKQVEIEIIDRAFEEGWVHPVLPEVRTGHSVAVVGSGPAGLAAAQQLTRAGHDVTVYERADRIGGLLRYGIPEFKMEKKRLDRRLTQMLDEGTHFVAGVEVGGPGEHDLSVDDLRSRHEAVVLAVGATAWRDLDITGRELDGVHQAMEYLPPSNKVQQGDYSRSFIDAENQHVVIIGGGDTGADCLGTAHRQGAATVTQLEIMPVPPHERPNANPWPTYPMIFRISSAHEEGGERLFSVNTNQFIGDDDGHVRELELVDVERVDGRFQPVEDSERRIPADLVFLAMGFLGPQKEGLLDGLGVDYDDRGNVVRGQDYQSSEPGVFVAGDAGRGQSLIVWAIAEGRAAAAGVDEYLTGRPTVLPRPINPTDRPLT